MRSMIKLTTTSALVLTLAASPLMAQSSGSGDSGSQSSDSQAQSSKSGSGNSSSGSSSGDSSKSAQSDENPRVVTVGDIDILRSDVTATISALPPQMREQPAEMLVPMAVNQLIMRELILMAATDENLDEDPEVAKLVENEQRASEEDAMVQVWLQRELDNSVTDKEVKAEYEEIKTNTDQDVPPLDAVRAQIEQQLRQEAFAGIQENLRNDVQITFYGPDGEPQEVSSENKGSDEN